MTFLDVGQGDSAVIELPQGAVVLIDGGATYEQVDMGRSVVAPFLWNREFDTSITSSDASAVGSCRRVGLDFGPFQVEHFWTNGVTARPGFWQRLGERSCSGMYRPRWHRRGDSWRRRAVAAWWR